jgi:hypothetical protein
MLALLAIVATVLTIQSPARVQALGADGTRVAYAAGFSSGDCNRVYVWNLLTRKTVKLGRKTHCQQTSTGNRISAVSLAGTRALWLQFQGGNRREYTLWTATPTRPAPILIRSIEVDVDDPAPIVIGEGDASRNGDILPYATGATVTALRANGSRALRWEAPARVTALAATGGELAVGSADGSVTVLDSRGRLLRSTPGTVTPSAVAVTGSGVVVQRGRTLEHLSTGRTFLLPAGARLQDAAGPAAAYELRGVVYRLDLLTGRRTVLARGTYAQLEPGRTITASGRVVTAR